MKILTLNTHSLIEEDYLRKLTLFVERVILEMPDLIALQEVNQTADGAEAEPDLLEGFAEPFGEIPVRSDNHAAWIVYLLGKAGIPVSWVWRPVKLGYGRFDEGLALLSLCGRIAEVREVCLSGRADYGNWKTRKALGARVDGRSDWVYNAHLGWWDDEEEPFRRQWGKLLREMPDCEVGANIWLTGDFNSPAEVRGEGYDLIAADGWLDTWRLAETTSGSYTVEGAIDGWRGRAGCMDGDRMRVDHIWCLRPEAVRSVAVIFDGENGPRISDHCGILMETRAK